MQFTVQQLCVSSKTKFIVFLTTLLVAVNVNLETAVHCAVKLVYRSGGARQEDCNPEMVTSCRGEIKKEWCGFFSD